MASIERRRGRRRDASGRLREVVHYRVRYRDSRGKNHSETFARMADAERRRVEIAHELTSGTWHDRHRGDNLLRSWVADWLPTRHDLRATTKVRLEVTMNRQVLPRFGEIALTEITNSDVRRWVIELMDSNLSAATTRKAVFAYRQALEAAIADQRIVHNTAAAVPLPSERSKPARFLSQKEVERLVAEVPPRDRALVLVGTYAGLRWGEAAGLRRRDVDPLRSRVRVTSTAVELHGKVTLDNEPKTTRSKRTIPIARAVTRRIEQHLDEHVDTSSDSLVFTALNGGPLYRSWGQKVLQPAVASAGLPGITFHGLRRSFVAIMVAASCNVREVSEWAGHNSWILTLPARAIEIYLVLKEATGSRADHTAVLSGTRKFSMTFPTRPGLVVLGTSRKQGYISSKRSSARRRRRPSTSRSGGACATR